MKIGIDALTLVPGNTGGVETYINNLIKNIATIDTQYEYLVFALPQAADALSFGHKNIQVNVCRMSAIKGLNTCLRVLYQQLVLPGKIKRLDIDVMIFTSNIGCLRCPCPSLLIIHDLIRHYCAANLPGQIGYVREKILPALIGASARAVTRIAAISEFTKQDIINRLAIPAEKIEVVHNGVDENLRGTASNCNGKNILSKIKQPYILFVGYHHPHKNLVRLVQAFVMMKDRTRISHALIIAGRKEAGTQALMREVHSHNRRDIFVLGAVSSDELLELYKGASLFVLPSLIEGFGLPLLEAMSFGVPIAASNAGSIPEVVGDAAVLFDPEDVNSMANTVEMALLDRKLSQHLVKKGYARVRETGSFSWHAAAKKILALAEEISEQPSVGFTLVH
ncbi:glycosyltransferase family 4 protein [bacterium]|nr:glycosyltransferase family 4 protein [bacterium]